MRTLKKYLLLGKNVFRGLYVRLCLCSSCSLLMSLPVLLPSFVSFCFCGKLSSVADCTMLSYISFLSLSFSRTFSNDLQVTVFSGRAVLGILILRGKLRSVADCSMLPS